MNNEILQKMVEKLSEENLDVSFDIVHISIKGYVQQADVIFKVP